MCEYINTSHVWVYCYWVVCGYIFTGSCVGIFLLGHVCVYCYWVMCVYIITGLCVSISILVVCGY